MIAKCVLFFGKPALIACDAQCHKAWGINKRPEVELDPDNDDDTAYLADDELGEAPADPRTYEGGDGKPQTPEQRLNRWCARECERRSTFALGALVTAAELRSFAQRVYNQPWKHPEGGSP